MRFVLYKHTNKKTNKAYIGYTSTTLEKRFQRHKDDARRGSPQHFHRAIRKHGTECWESEILIECSSLYTAWGLEQQLIKKHNTYGRTGYNMTLGGEGGSGRKHKKSSIEKMRKWHLNFKHSPETKQKMKIDQTTRRGRPVNQYSKEGMYITTFLTSVDAAEFLGNKNLSGSIYQVCSQSFKRWKQNLVKGFQWQFDSQINRQQISAVVDLQTNRVDKLRQSSLSRSKQIQQLTLDGNFIKDFSSINEASRYTNIYRSGIERCCNKKLLTAGGYKWQYV